MPRRTVLFLLAMLAPAAGLADDRLGAPLDNDTAFIPPQCYTDTLDADGIAHNPCFTCHVKSRAPNYINDSDLQLSYAFPAPALANPWTNLFEDRRRRIAAISDDDILKYIRTDNYLTLEGTIRLASILAAPPKNWDADGDGRWSGYVPDVYFRFDSDGYDLAPDGGRTGWRAFAYTPLPGSFSPASRLDRRRAHPPARRLSRGRRGQARLDRLRGEPRHRRGAHPPRRCDHRARQ